MSLTTTIVLLSNMKTDYDYRAIQCMWNILKVDDNKSGDKLIMKSTRQGLKAIHIHTIVVLHCWIHFILFFFLLI